MMYLLLRDNKQSGPYSLDDLKVKGLKAYDLVWVEGRSAAWRYPSEVDELKAFAPVVEEQPFDRFFRKPAAALHEKGTTELSSGTTGSNDDAASNRFKSQFDTADDICNHARWHNHQRAGSGVGPGSRGSSGGCSRFHSDAGVCCCP